MVSFGKNVFVNEVSGLKSILMMVMFGVRSSLLFGFIFKEILFMMLIHSQTY